SDSEIQRRVITQAKTTEQRAWLAEVLSVALVQSWLASSTTCSACGNRLDELPLRMGQWSCPTCSVTHDRDHNAAKVILAAGRAERLNACGDHARPQPVAAVDDETGSTPTAA
ncbi:MAG TPA: zinc ribbon domain-containing protein, partial [Mycobacterium sp.]|nr:zinc ribbon domain-containing protein [Mycobacterium sp.]